jgi:hypothetical protein
LSEVLSHRTARLTHLEAVCGCPIQACCRGTPARLLSPRDNDEIYVAVRSGQCTQREAAAKWSVDVHVCRTAKQGALDQLAASVPGRAGLSAEQAAMGRGGSRGGPVAGVQCCRDVLVAEMRLNVLD